MAAGKASVLQKSQFGLESVAGTLVNAGKRMPNLMVAGYPVFGTKEYRGQGFKAPSQLVTNKQSSEFEYSGLATYDEMAYILAGIFSKVSPVTTSTAIQTWTFLSAYDAADTPATYTIEHGDAGRAGRLGYGLFTDMTFKTTRESVEVSGKGIGQDWHTNHALTATPTLITSVPIAANEITITVDAAYGDLGTTPLTSAYEWEFGITNRWAPDWVLNGSLTSWKDHVELPYTFSLKGNLANDATSDAFIAQVLAEQTQYLTIQALGPAIPGSSPTGYYSIDFKLPFQVKGGGKPKDLAGVYVCDWELMPVIDSNLGYAMQCVLVNDLASL